MAPVFWYKEIKSNFIDHQDKVTSRPMPQSKRNLQKGGTWKPFWQMQYIGGTYKLFDTG